MKPRYRVAAGVAAVATLAVAGAAGAPRLTLSNDGISIDYPAHLGVALIVAAALVGAGVSRVHGALRWTLVALTLAFAGLGAGRLTYSVAASREGLRQQSLFGETTLAWKTLSRVDLEPGRIVAWGAGDTPIRIGTASLTAQQRASLERTISRRVREATTPTVAERDPKPEASRREPSTGEARPRAPAPQPSLPRR